jgi:2'-5' RNA ligase
MRTVGISIPIPEPQGSFLREKRRSFGDAMADRVPSHITLAPPLEIEDEALESLVEHLTVVAANQAPFEVALAGTSSFRPTSPVVFVTVAEGVEQVATLAGAIRSRIDLPSPEFPFHPHVTVAHNIADDKLDEALADLQGFEFRFAVADFQLYVDDPEQGWLPTHTFPLA